MKIFGLSALSASEASALTHMLEGREAQNLYHTKTFAVVTNPKSTQPLFDLYPLAEATFTKLSHLSAILTDMDGTTTTTETLCLSALAYMVSVVCGKLESGMSLDPQRDYPHIIGNSTTKHVEYLMTTYKTQLTYEAIARGFWRAALWTLRYGQEPTRVTDVREHLQNLGLLERALRESVQVTSLPMPVMHLERVPHAELIKIASDIYYQRYHETLMQLAKGAGPLAKSPSAVPLIAPMPGVLAFLSLAKGLLNTKSAAYFPELRAIPKEKRDRLVSYFVRHPVKIGLVTSSIRYEANIVLSEVFRLLIKQITSLALPKGTEQPLLSAFAHYETFYDTVVTASDSNEIRLKPHRDLYTIALRKLGLSPKDFPFTLGLEDSESGLIAIRAAGIPHAIAFPFEHTKGHNLQASTRIVTGGLPAFISSHLCMLDL